MTYAPGTDEFLARYHEAMPSDFHRQPVEEQRRLYLSLSDVFPYPVPEGLTIDEREVTWQGRRQRIRIYRPDRRSGPGLLVYLHGGGFVVGSPDTHHTLVAELAAKTGLVAVSPWLRQSPEHPFPAALEDCYDVLCAMAADPGILGPDVDATRPVVGGDSSGANLTVAVAMACRDRKGPRLRGQALVGPVLDFARWWGSDDPGFGPEMDYYTRSYCATEETTRHPYVSPLVSGGFHDLPPAYIMSTELDELRGDAERYAEQLRRHGIPVELVIEPGLVHAPVRGRSVIPQVADAWERYCAAAGRLASTSAPSMAADAAV